DYASPGVARSGFGKGIFGWVLFIGLAIMLFVLLRQQQVSAQDLSLSEFKEMLMAGKIAVVQVQSDQLSGDFNSAGAPARFRVQLPQGMGTSWNFVEWVLDNRGTAEVRCDNGQNLLRQVILPFVPWLLVFGFVW